MYRVEYIEDIGKIAGYGLMTDLKPEGETVYPFVEVDQDKYEEIERIHANWINPTTLEVANRDFRELREVQLDKIYSLKYECDKAILSGFTSSTLGTEHKYQCAIYDQLNIHTKAIGVGDKQIRCSEDDGETWAEKTHTQRQVTVLNNHLNVHIDRNTRKFQQLKQQVNAATTPEQVEAIVWS